MSSELLNIHLIQFSPEQGAPSPSEGGAFPPFGGIKGGFFICIIAKTNRPLIKKKEIEKMTERINRSNHAVAIGKKNHDNYFIIKHLHQAPPKFCN